MFYTYNQNNSGGFFKITKKIKHYVIIEADSAKEANKKAEHIGIYFDGVKKTLIVPVVEIDGIKCLKKTERKSQKYTAKMPHHIWRLGSSSFVDFPQKRK